MTTASPHVIFIPLDARPVCCAWIGQLGAMAGLDLRMAPSESLGHLKRPGDWHALQTWLTIELKQAPVMTPIIAALDTVAYGGLIASRVNQDSLETLKAHIDGFLTEVQNHPVYGFSSILRIPAYDSSEEEPDYWARYGHALYAYSISGGRQASEPIPKAVLDDFLARRAKNDALNRCYIDALQANRLQYLTFCQDDTGPIGLNVQEAAVLREKLAHLQNVSPFNPKGHVQTGADETGACLLARWTLQQDEKPVSVFIFYSDPQGQSLNARFDGIPIEAVARQAIAACGGVLAEAAETADCWLLVHVPHVHQGDHCAGIVSDATDTARQAVIETFIRARALNKPCILADVASANGSDPQLGTLLVTAFTNLSFLYGYAGWNTPGNTLGSAVSMGLLRLWAEQHGCFNEAAFRRMLLIRLADDWLYQGEIRQILRQLTSFPPTRALLPLQGGGDSLDVSHLNVLMSDGISLLKSRLSLEDTSIQCGFPCGRLFEIEVALS